MNDFEESCISSSHPRWRIGRLTLLGVFGLAIVVGIGSLLANQLSEWRRFKADLRTYHGVSVGQTKKDVQYALGTPQTVQGPEIRQKDGWLTSSPLRLLSGDKDGLVPAGYDLAPRNKSAEDYDEWHYWNRTAWFHVNFNKRTQRVETIQCWVRNEGSDGCEPIFGVRSNTSEAQVLKRLGTPDKTEITGGGMLLDSPIAVVKFMEYDALGLSLALQKQKVSTITKRAPQDVGMVWWLRHGRP